MIVSENRPDVKKAWALAVGSFRLSPLSAFSIVEMVCRNVKRWRGGDHLKRWVGSALSVAEKKFRRVRGYQQIPQLLEALTAQLSKKGVAKVAGAA